MRCTTRMLCFAINLDAEHAVTRPGAHAQLANPGGAR